LNKIIPAYFLIFVLILGTMSTISPISSNAFAEETKIFPDWVRTVFTFWANGDVTDEDLKNALEFLITNKILDLEKKQTTSIAVEKSNITVDDDNFFSVAQDTITGWVNEIRNNPTANLMVKSALPVIPVIGPLLSNLYEGSDKTPTEINKQMLEILENYQKMNKDQLKAAFTGLEKNHDAIKNNKYLLDDVLTDTKQILVITTETNVIVKNLEIKLDLVLAQLSDIKVGKNVVAVSSELKTQLNEITQLASESGSNDDLNTSQLEALAKSYLLQDDFNSAINTYDQILQQDSKNYNALNEKAWALYELGEFSQSSVAFNELLTHYPEDSVGWENKGWALLESGGNNLDKAKDSFNESVKIDSSNAYAIAGLGWVSLEEGNCQMAESIFYDALEIDEYNVDALDGLDEIDYGDYC